MKFNKKKKRIILINGTQKHDEFKSVLQLHRHPLPHAYETRTGQDEMCAPFHCGKNQVETLLDMPFPLRNETRRL